MSAKYQDLTPEQFKAFVALPNEGPYQMLNLLKFKDHVEASGLSGEEHYKTYMKAVAPFFEKSNANVLYSGKANFSLIGPSDGEEWDKVLIIEYAKKSDFLDMITTEGYPAKIRRQAIEDSRLIFCSPI